MNVARQSNWAGSDPDTLLRADWKTLAPLARARREMHWGTRLTYSRKVFIPLTQLCRDVCHYCTFARTPSRLDGAYLTEDQVLRIARDGAAAGCKEALFTLGDKPELRYRAAREALQRLGFASTLEYLAHLARRVREETGLLPHLNPGLLEPADYEMLRASAPSMGIMLETSSERLCARGGPHFGSPDKIPERRLASLDAAGLARVPMTTGILIGIGETRSERIDALLKIRDLAMRHDHIQEVIIQNFRAKAGTLMQNAPEPDAEDLYWTIAVARLLLPANVSLQVPPNLNPGHLERLIEVGINDWGGVSPVTQDHVNPEAPWPTLDQLARTCESAGFDLVERLTVYPSYVQQAERWIDTRLRAPVMRLSDGAGLARVGRWIAGDPAAANADDVRDVSRNLPMRRDSVVSTLVKSIMAGEAPDASQIAALFTARGADFDEVCNAADQLRRETVGDTVSFAVVRNINYTNICRYKCSFCAFAKGRRHAQLRGEPYRVSLDEIARRTREAWDRGATEVCMQGGIHPEFNGQTYLDICRAAKDAAPGIHVHAFSPLEVHHGAATMDLSVEQFLNDLKVAGLGSLPGTAAEILDDEVRRELAPDKLDTEGWLSVVATAHQVGLRTTSTIMFGHIDSYAHWARHLLRLRELQLRTGGITEFVPLPFVHMEAPMYLRGRARKGPSLRECILMHAVSRLVLHPLIKNIQVSWVKLGPDWAQHCLRAGANDLGGTLMNESISRAAGAGHGQELGPLQMESLIRQIGRTPMQRTTLYRPANLERRQAAQVAAPLAPVINEPIRTLRSNRAVA